MREHAREGPRLEPGVRTHLARLLEAGWIAPRVHDRRIHWYGVLNGRIYKLSAVRNPLAGSVKTTPNPP